MQFMDYRQSGPEFHSTPGFSFLLCLLCSRKSTPDNKTETRYDKFSVYVSVIPLLSLHPDSDAALKTLKDA